MYLAMEFLIGQLLHIIKRCDLVLQSPKNEAKTVRDYVRGYGVGLIFKLALGVGLFSGILSNPWLLTMIWKPLAALRWTPATAFVAGLVFDNALDWVIERYPAARRFLG